MADKVNYYLEQSIPELKELEKSGLFSKKELNTITRRRTDFEYRVTGRQTRPKDFLQYAEFEMNFDALRAKRMKRTGIKSDGAAKWGGSRRIYFILDRGTRKFSGNIQLWLQYIDYAKKEKAVKQLTKIFSKLLPLHPSKPALWILAAKYEIDENGDLSAARNLFQRGLSFNKHSRALWLEYAKMELLYLSKLIAKRKLIEMSENLEEESIGLNEKEGDSSISLPSSFGEELRQEINRLPEATKSALEGNESNPVLSGTILTIIYDAAQQEFHNDPRLASDFLDLIDSFPQVDRDSLGSQIMDRLMAAPQSSLEAQKLYVWYPFRNLSSQDPALPSALRESLARFKSQSTAADRPTELSEFYTEKLENLLLSDNIHDVVKKAIKAVLKQVKDK